MSLIPDEKLKSNLSFNMTPMIDFLFLMLAFFATLAVSRTSLFDSKLSLVEINNTKEAPLIHTNMKNYQINLAITNDGSYRWITDIHEYPMKDTTNVQYEISHQYNIGILPKEKNNTEILLHIDKNAPWESIAKLIYAIKELGYEPKPVFQNHS